MWKMQVIIIGPASKGYCEVVIRESLCKVHATVLLGGVGNLLSNVKVASVIMLANDP